MEELVLQTATSSCQISIGAGLAPHLGVIVKSNQFSSFALISDQNVPIDLLQPFRAVLKPLALQRSLSGGDELKSIDGASEVWRTFSSAKLDRSTLVVIVGGGAICDLVGFCCSTYHRGIPFALIPTTLLAQVDAGIGGKNAINHLGVKNLIGTICQPRFVLNDVTFLSSLPRREFNSGLAEVLKAALVRDMGLCDVLMHQRWAHTSGDSQLERIVARACRIKTEIVEADERDQSVRRLLNFGHTFGHAIEAAAMLSSRPLLHGESVALGILAESFLSFDFGFISVADLELIERLVYCCGLPQRLDSGVNRQIILDRLGQDKKHLAGRLRWTLLKALGRGICDIEVDWSRIEHALEYLTSKEPSIQQQ